MTPKMILPLLAAAGLVACEQKQQFPVKVDQEMVELGAEVQKYVRSFPGWYALTDEMIVYGKSVQDDGGPSVGCLMSAGEGAVTVSMGINRRPEGPPVPPKEDEFHDGYWTSEMTVASGGASATVPARITSAGRLGYTARTEPGLPAGHPVLAAFARTGELTVTSRGETRASGPAPLPLVAKMLEACGAAPGDTVS